MNDRYKFRGKRVDSGGWVYGNLVECAITGKKYILPSGSDANESGKVGEDGCLRIVTFEIIPETVGQYTGLKDKNGVEIYEGDVVNMHYFFENFHPSSLGIFEDEKEVIGIVGMDECGTFTENDSEIYYWFNYLQDPNEELEVIGNIHDNLLEE